MSEFDAAGRARASLISTLGDYTHVYGQAPLFFDFVGTGSRTFVSASAADELTVDPGEYCVLQTKMWHPYRTGKSQVVEMTTYGLEVVPGLTKRLGYFSSGIVAPYTADFDGFFIENDGTDGLSFKMYRAGNLTINIPRSSWFDRLDGAGPSRVQLSWNNFNVFMFDFLYLGGTTLRGFVHARGAWRPFILYHHAGTTPYVFMQSPNQPLRFELRSASASGTLGIVCSSVASEGAADPVGVLRGIYTGTSAITGLGTGTKYALLGSRLDATKRGVGIELVNASVLATTNDNYLWELILNPTVAGTFTYSALSDSALQYAVGAAANTVSGGTVLTAGYGQQDAVTALSFQNSLRHGSKIDGTTDTIVLCVTPLSASMGCHASMTLRELQ